MAEHVTVPLTRGYEALIDAEDYARVSCLNWYAVTPLGSLTAYAYAFIPGGHGKRVMLHRLIAGVPDGVPLDHRNRNGLDCRRANLRPATSSLNSANRKSQNPRSGFRGVFKKHDCERWEAYIRVNGKRRYLGLYPDPESAARAYDNAAAEAFGAFASTNMEGRVAA